LRSSAAGLNFLTIFRLRNSRFERDLNRDGIGIVYFLSPNLSALTVRSLPIITTVWDLGHLDLPYYPEIAGGKYFAEREYYFQDTLRRSTLIVTDSDVLAQQISTSYRTTLKRILLMPFTEIISGLELSIERRMPSNVSNGRVILYPAQFWPHKRHVLLVRAFAQVLDHEQNVRLVLVGGDKGNRSHVESEIKRLDIADYVEIVNFLPRDDLIQMIAQSCLVVYPSELGPTNLPPLEAESLGIPTVVSASSSVGLPESEIRTVVQDQSPDSWATAIRSGLQHACDIFSPIEEMRSIDATNFSPSGAHQKEQYSGIQNLFNHIEHLKTHFDEWDQRMFQRDDSRAHLESKGDR
jgi:glycosyltransferase involved in cell wall biosynthesis